MKWLKYIGIILEIVGRLSEAYKRWKYNTRLARETEVLENEEKKSLKKARPSRHINSVYSSIRVIDDDSLRELEKSKGTKGSDDS